MKSLRFLTDGIRSTVAVALIAASGWTHAASLQWSFSATVASGLYAGTVGSGTFEYDSSVILGTGNETIEPADGLTVSFALLGQHFMRENDVDFPEFPTLSFLNGMPVEINYVLVNGVNGVSFTTPGIDAVDVIGTLVPSSGVDFLAPLLITAAVPEPTTMAMFGAGLLALYLRRRR